MCVVLLLLTLLVLTSFTTALVLAPPLLLRRLMPLRDIPMMFRGVILIMAFVYIVIAIFCERLLFPSMARLGKRAIKKQRQHQLHSERATSRV